jgi:hypothetical protein
MLAEIRTVRYGFVSHISTVKHEPKQGTGIIESSGAVAYMHHALYCIVYPRPGANGSSGAFQLGLVKKADRSMSTHAHLQAPAPGLRPHISTTSYNRSESVSMLRYSRNSIGIPAVCADKENRPLCLYSSCSKVNMQPGQLLTNKSSSLLLHLAA